MMTPNIGPIDRVLRAVVGISVLSLIFYGPQSWYGLFGLVPLVTALIGWCPPYAMLGVSTCQAKK